MGVALPERLTGPVLDLSLSAFTDDHDLQIVNNTTGRSLVLDMGASWDGDDLSIDFERKTITDQTGADRLALASASARDLLDDAVDEAFALGSDNEISIRAQEVAVFTVSGPNSADVGADDSAFGGNAWTNTGAVISSNNDRASVNFMASDDSHYLKITDFDFALPSSAVISGIRVEIERSAAHDNTVKDRRVRLVKGGTILSTDRALPAFWPGGSADAYAGYGSFVDLWGTSWAYTDINATNFGVAIAAYRAAGAFVTAYVDHARIIVYYTVTPTPSAYNGAATWRWREAFA